MASTIKIPTLSRELMLSAAYRRASELFPQQHSLYDDPYLKRKAADAVVSNRMKLIAAHDYVFFNTRGGSK